MTALSLLRAIPDIHRLHRLLSLWLFGDVAYAVLPIIVLALITSLLGASFHDFPLIKEWSFATIVFFGVSIRKLIRLKIDIQQTPRSYKLDTGVQIYVFMLIGAVLVLSLVVLLEKGALPTKHAVALGVAQLVLFVMGVFSTFVSVWAEDEYLRRLSRLPDGISRAWLLQQLNSELSRADSCLDYVLYAIERAPTIRFARSDDVVDARRDEEKEASLFLAALDRIAGLVAAARNGPDIVKQVAADEGVPERVSG